MDILAAIKREERKLEKQLGKLQHQLSGVRAAAKALGSSSEREVIGVRSASYRLLAKQRLRGRRRTGGRRLGLGLS
jgi:hypothetical protein